MDTEIKNFRRRLERNFGKAVGLGSSGLQKVSSLLLGVEIFSYSGYSCSRGAGLRGDICSYPFWGLFRIRFGVIKCSIQRGVFGLICRPFLGQFHGWCVD